MKTFVPFLVSFLLSISVHPQATYINDTSVSVRSEHVDIIHSPTDFVKTIIIATNKYKNGRLGIEFSYILAQKKTMPEIVSEKIVLTYSKNKFLNINNPYQDTIYYRKEGGLYLNVIHWLDKDQASTLRQNVMTAITLKVDGKPMTFKISKKSQQDLYDLTRQNL